MRYNKKSCNNSYNSTDTKFTPTRTKQSRNKANLAKAVENIKYQPILSQLLLWFLCLRGYNLKIWIGKMGKRWSLWAKFDHLTSFDFTVKVTWAQQVLFLFINLNINTILGSYSESKSYLIFLTILILQQQN